MNFNFLKKSLFFIFIFFLLISPILSVFAQDNTGGNESGSTYTPLATLPGLESFDSSQECAFGIYLKNLINLSMGVIIVIAVVMIVTGGIEYIGSEVISSKQSGMQKVQNAFFGILLVLSIYILLRSVNPRLLNMCLVLPDVTVTVSEFETLADAEEMFSAYPSPGQFNPKSCPEGVVPVRVNSNTTYVCSSVSGKIQSLFLSAQIAGLNLTGGGFRTYEKQVSLRRQYCGTTEYDIYQKPSSECSRPVAIPGTSMHESGKAIDFKCNGSFITSKSSPCFIWLKNNAASFGLYNLESEPWHWSTTGR